MKHITEYMNRKAALNCYNHHRKRYDMKTSMIIAQAKFAVKPMKRLACVIALQTFGILENGRVK